MIDWRSIASGYLGEIAMACLDLKLFPETDSRQQLFIAIRCHSHKTYIDKYLFFSFKNYVNCILNDLDLQMTFDL